MAGQMVWEQRMQFRLLDWLEVGSAVRALQTNRCSSASCPACIKSKSSLWDSHCLSSFPFVALMKQCEQYSKCMATVHADPRFTFHEQYQGNVEDFCEDGLRPLDPGISKFGLMHGWRPGLPWPRRDANMSRETDAKFEYNLFPGASDPSVHPSVTFPSRMAQSAAVASTDCFIDSLDATLLIAVHERPPAMMLKGGAANLLGVWNDAMLVWFLNSYFCHDEFWCAAIGFVDCSGDFVLVSGASYGDSYRGQGISDRDIENNDFSKCSVYPLDEFASVRLRSWDHMLEVFCQCWNDAARDKLQQENSQPPDCLGLKFDDAGDKFYSTEQFRLTRRFQRRFHRMAKTKVRMQDAAWSISMDEDMEISNCTDDGYWPLPYTLRHAALGQIATFHEIVGNGALPPREML